MKKVIRHQLLRWGSLALISFSFFFALQYNAAFADPDSFYHTKMALLMSERGVITEFPWLGEFTILGDAYTNQHFLYHALLIPFVTVFEPIAGVKLATALLATGVVLALYWAGQRLQIRWSWLFAVMLLGIGPAIFRLSLTKAPALSMIILIVGLLWALEYRWRRVGVLAAVYVWAYGGFALLTVMCGFSVAVDVARWAGATVRNWPKVDRRGWYGFWRLRAWRVIAAALGGTVVGLVLNPYFPTNLRHYWYQLYEIGVKNYQEVIGVGGEWYPYTLSSLVSDTTILSLAVLSALGLMILRWRHVSRAQLVLLLSWLFFLVLTLKSRRYVEYYVPFSLLFSASVIGVWLKELRLSSWLGRFSRAPVYQQGVAAVTLVYLLVTIPTAVGTSISGEYRSLQGGASVTELRQSAEWLAAHSNPGDIVLHSDWDEFPNLFYYNDVNYYIVGLDATFMYLHNAEQYRVWVDITTGRLRDGLANTVRETFRARYVFATRDHTSLIHNLSAQEGFRLVYEDSEASIFEVK